jgi:hypothetical protein
LVLNTIQSFFGSGQESPEQKAADPGKLSENLRNLMNAMSQYRIVPYADIYRLKDNLSGAPVAPLLIRLERQIENFDYSGGMATVNEIALALSINL